MIVNNKELYSAVSDLSKLLQDCGEEKWSERLLDALSISTLPGEILGEIRIRLRELPALQFASRPEIRNLIADALVYLDSVLT